MSMLDKAFYLAGWREGKRIIDAYGIRAVFMARRERQSHPQPFRSGMTDAILAAMEDGR